LSESNKRPKKTTRAARARRHSGGGDVSVAKQAAQHKKIRRDHSGEITEDYVEMIAQLIREHGEARTVELARRLGVSHVTVTKKIARLQREGLVRSQPYRSIFLTDGGTELALRAEERHRLVVEFLQKLGVNAADAEADAEGIEHHVSEATMAAIRRFVRRV
jgi:DtxR family manganese transport transcriptional regulator